MSSESQEGQISKDDSQFSVDLKTNKIKKRTKKKKVKKTTPKIITSTYKKQKCLHFNKGNCTKGQTCTFSHDFQPQSTKIICKYFLSNSCSKGAECNFSHNTQSYPCRFFHLQNRCNQRSQCRFSHMPAAKQYLNDFLKENKELIMNLSRQHKLGTISDENLKKEVLSFVSKESLQEQPKKKGFKGELKLLAQNSIQLNETVVKPKIIDPRLRMKASKPIKFEENGRIDVELGSRQWIFEVTQKFQQEKNERQAKDIDRKLLQKFLYSYY